MDPQLRVDDRIGVFAHLCAANRMIDGLGGFSNERVDLVVAANMRTGHELGSTIRIESLLCKNLTRDFHALAKSAPIFFGFEVVRLYERCDKGIGRLDRDVSSALGAQLAYVGHEAVAVGAAPGVVVHERRDKMILKIG